MILINLVMMVLPLHSPSRVDGAPSTSADRRGNHQTFPCPHQKLLPRLQELLQSRRRARRNPLARFHVASALPSTSAPHAAVPVPKQGVLAHAAARGNLVAVAMAAGNIRLLDSPILPASISQQLRPASPNALRLFAMLMDRCPPPLTPLSL